MALSEGAITASLLLICFVLQGTKLRGKEQDKLKPPFRQMWQCTPTTSVFRVEVGTAQGQFETHGELEASLAT